MKTKDHRKPKFKGWLYVVENKVLGIPVYVGQAKNANKRVGRHKTASRLANPSQEIDQHLKDVGLENFFFRILPQVYDSQVALNKAEHNTALRLNTYRKTNAFGMNMRECGRGGTGFTSDETRAKIAASHTGKKHSAESRAKMSASHEGKKLSAEHRANIGAAFKGKKLSAEHRAKIGAANKGKPKSAEHRAKLSAANKGKKKSAETCAKMSASLKNPSAETRAKLSAAGKGKPKSAEHIAKISAAKKGKPKRDWPPELQCSVKGCRLRRKRTSSTMCRRHYSEQVT